MTLGVVIADDDRFVRALTVRVLSMKPGIEADSGDELADALRDAVSARAG